MIVTFDDTRNMYSETLVSFKDISSVPVCEYCGGKIGYNKSISYMSCSGVLPNGQRCNDRHGNKYKEVFEFNESEYNELKEFSAYCQTLKPFIKSHSHYKLNATMPIKYARSIKYDRKSDAKIESLVKFCEKFHDNHPDLAKEVSVTLYHPEYTKDDVREFMYTVTKDEKYLSGEAKDIFIF